MKYIGKIDHIANAIFKVTFNNESYPKSMDQ